MKLTGSPRPLTPIDRLVTALAVALWLALVAVCGVVCCELAAWFK